MSLSDRDKDYIQKRLIRITDAKEEICKKVKNKGSCKECPLNELDRCNNLDLPPLDRKTMRLEKLD